MIMIMLLCWFSVAKLCPSHCDLMNFSTPDSSVFHYWRLLRFMSIESVMPSNHLILCHPLLLLPSIFPSIRVFSSESALCIRWPKYWSLSFSVSPSSEHLWSHNQREIKRHLLLGRKAMTNLDSILKSKDITLLTNLHTASQSYGFSNSHV